MSQISPVEGEMSTSRFKKIDSIYQEALKLGPEARSAYLSAVCEGDADLRKEIEALLAGSTTSIRTIPEATVTIVSVGTQLGPYRIEAPIGAGGMGQVFRGIDTRLGRNVAIKISHEKFNERFEREARAISALNHPHICTLYDIGTSPSGVSYLVMELLEGETLAAKLKRGKLSLEETVRYGAQIADALAAAHAKGIIHRDLKPANVMITKAGVKVLDFGLAKSALDATVTASNVAMGTPAYMAPEQFEGKEADARTDIYALGLVLYEMVSGKRAPQAQMPRLDVLAPQLAHVVERCLGHDPDERWQTVREVKALLEWAPKTQAQGSDAAVSPLRRWTPITAALVVIVGAGGAFWAARRTGPTSPDRPARFTLSFTDQQILGDDMPVPSPDGRSLVFQAVNAQGGASLWLRPLDSTEAKIIPGTENAQAAFWSPDGRWIAFFAAGKLKKVDPNGGAPQTIAEMPLFQEGAWGANGDIIFRPNNRTPLFRLREGGGAPVPLTQLDASRTENSHRGLSFLPGGQKFLFTARCVDRANNAVFIGSIDPPRIKRLISVQSSVQYVPPKGAKPGALVFYKDGGLFAQPFNAEAEELAGEAVAIVTEVGYRAIGLQAYFRISGDGSLTVVRPSGASDSQFMWFNRSGEKIGTLGAPGEGNQPRISPDGTRVAFNRPDPQTGNRDIYSIEISRGLETRLTTHVANDWFPVWSPDGKRILFGSDRQGGPRNDAFLKNSADSAANESPVQGGPDEPKDWSPDGKWIAGGSADIFIGPAQGGRSFPFLATKFKEGGARFSPDGKWIAYTSNETGRDEVYVRRFNGGPASPEGRIQISNDTGSFPVWRRDGKELYYLARDFSLYAVNTSELGKSDSVSSPMKLFRACGNGVPVNPPAIGQDYGYSFDTVDGKKFLINCTLEPPGRFVALLNWPFAAKR